MFTTALPIPSNTQRSNDYTPAGHALAGGPAAPTASPLLHDGTIPSNTQRSNDYTSAGHALAGGPAAPTASPPYYMTERYRAIPNGVTITHQPGTHWLAALPPLRRPPYYMMERYRAIPNGVTITDQPGTHWLAALPPAEKPPAVEPSGVFRLGFGKKRGRKEDLHKERRRLTASVTFLFIRYLPDLNSQ